MEMKLTNEQWEFIREHLNDRPRAKYIAELGVSPATFYRAVRILGGELRHELTKARPGIKECVIKYFPVMSAVEISRKFGYAKTPVLRWAKRLGIKSSPEKIERMQAEHVWRLREAHKKIDYAACARKRKARWRIDEYRVWEGLPQRTKMRIKSMPYKSYRAKWNLMKAYGYEKTEDPYVLLVTEKTRRKSNEAYYGEKYKLLFRESPKMQEAM